MVDDDGSVCNFLTMSTDISSIFVALFVGHVLVGFIVVDHQVGLAPSDEQEKGESISYACRGPPNSANF